MCDVHAQCDNGVGSSSRTVIFLYDHHPSWHSGGRANLSSRSRLDLILRCRPVLAREYLPSPLVSQDSVPVFWHPNQQDSQVFPDFCHSRRVMDNSKLDFCLNSRGSNSNPHSSNSRCKRASQVNMDNKELLPPFLQFLPSSNSTNPHSNHNNRTGFSAHPLARALVTPLALVSFRSLLGFLVVEVSQHALS